MCWMTDSEPLAGCRGWIKEKWFGAWWMSPYHLIYSSSGGGRKCIMLFVSISWNRDNLWIISIRWKPTSVVKHFVFSKNIGTHTNRAFCSWSLMVSNTFQYYLSFICTKIWTDLSTLCHRRPRNERFFICNIPQSWRHEGPDHSHHYDQIILHAEATAVQNIYCG